MEITLNKANKILEKLSSAELRNVSCEIRRTFKKNDFEVDILDKINKESSTQKENLLYNNAIINDKFLLKSLIFKKNCECGLSDIFAEIEIVKSKISRLQYITSRSCEESVYYESLDKEIDRIKENLLPEQNSFDIEFLVFEENNIKNSLKEEKRKLNELEDKKMALNATKTIEIQFSEQTLEFLGL